MWEVICPNTYHAEREYIISLLMGEFWGLDYHVVWSDEVRGKTIFQCDRKTIVVYDGLFQSSELVWLQEQSLPRQPLAIWDFAQEFPEAAPIQPCPLIYVAEIGRAHV